MSEQEIKLLAGRTVLVTGASGFIGQHLIAALSGCGAHVRALSRSVPTHVDRLSIDWRVGGLDEPSVLAAACEGAEVIVHLGATAVRTGADIEGLTHVNVAGTWNVLQAGARSGARPVVLLASTDRVYASTAALPRLETSDTAPRDPYALSKRCAEELALSFLRRDVLRGAVLRLANVYGPGDHNVSRLVPSIRAAIAQGEPLRLRGDGQTLRDFVFVGDAVRAFLAVAGHALQASSFCETFNVGSGVAVSTLELARTALEVAGRSDLSILVANGAEAADDASWLNSERIFGCVGWRPRVGLLEGLRLSLEID